MSAAPESERIARGSIATQDLSRQPVIAAGGVYSCLHGHRFKIEGMTILIDAGEGDVLCAMRSNDDGALGMRLTPGGARDVAAVLMAAADQAEAHAARNAGGLQ